MSTKKTTAPVEQVQQVPAQQQTAELAILFAADDGSGNIKHCFTDAAGNLFEGSSASCVVKDALPDLSGGTSKHAWSADGDDYTVTAKARNPEPTCNEAYQVSPVNRVLVHDAVASTEIGNHPVYLGVTLPTEQYYIKTVKSIRRNDEKIQAKKDNLMAETTNLTGEYQMPNIKGVRVFPEAIPAYVYCSLMPDGSQNPDYPAEHSTLVIDLGRFTCDMAVVRTGYNVTEFKTTEHGIDKMVSFLTDLLKENTKELNLHSTAAFSFADYEVIVDRGYIGSNSEKPEAVASRKDVSHLVTEAKEFLNSLVLKDALELVGGDFSMLDRIVFVGGGANWLREQSQEWFHTVDIPAEPEMAIARGVNLMLQSGKAQIFAEIEQAAAQVAEVEG